MRDPLKIPHDEDMSFEAAEWNTLRQGSQLSLDEKLEWLEDMLALMREFQTAKRLGHGVGQSDAANQDESMRKWSHGRLRQENE